MKSQADMNDGQASLKDSGHTWFYKEDIHKAAKDLEASRKHVKELEAKLHEAAITSNKKSELIESMKDKTATYGGKVLELEKKLAEAEKDLGKWLGIASDNDQLFLNEKFQKTHAEEKLKVAVEALEFYGSQNNWNSSKECPVMINHHEEKGGFFARATLKKISEGV